MNITTNANSFAEATAPRFPTKERFRDRFQIALRACVRRGFSLEEAFGMIWVETWEEFSLSETEQSELYEELIKWAKSTLFERNSQVIHQAHSAYSLVR